MEISVIIVSYNVKLLLLGLLHSLEQSLRKISSYEIIIVDNNSTDHTVDEVKQFYPQVLLIVNKINVGFSAANNQGIRQASGKYIVLINPDTLVEEALFTRLYQFMETSPEYGAITGKMINPDGSFAIDCRHGIPTPIDALWKSIGFSYLFPKIPFFSRYHQTYLDPDQPSDIPALSGAFMFLRKKAVMMIGELDESFFMYCEDIDYCKRLSEHKWKIRYFPEVVLLHFKGASTKKSDIHYIRNFNSSLVHFFDKHYSKTYSRPFNLLITTGINLRGVFIYIKNSLQEIISGKIKDSLNPGGNKQSTLILSSEKNGDPNLMNYLNSKKINHHLLVKYPEKSFAGIVNEILEHLSAEKTDSIIFDVVIGYDFIFKLMQTFTRDRIQFMFYYPGNRNLISHQSAINLDKDIHIL